MRKKQATKPNSQPVTPHQALSEALTIIDRLCEEYSAIAGKHASFTSGEFRRISAPLTNEDPQTKLNNIISLLEDAAKGRKLSITETIILNEAKK